MNNQNYTSAAHRAGKSARKFANPLFELLALCLALNGPLASSLCRAQAPIPLPDSTSPSPDRPIGAIIWTDKTDYSPGTLAVLTGKGFQAGETINLQVVHADGTPDTGVDHEIWTTVADANGTFQTQWHVCEDDCVGSILLATANGLTSGSTAQTLFTDSATTVAYLRSVVGQPWGQTANETAMNRVFGAGNWLDLRYESVNAASLLSPSTSFIFMEGGDSNADEMEAFLNANMATIQTWLSAGGRLFLNAAPNEGNGMSFGFGVTLNYA
ncbi:MAG TPA: hypothetical protein VFA77_02550, partial [Candidatus Eisenbacteria bacterium]|nr:hypothetical protein [Candidatus Eisenbacteria bacterium]